MHRSLLAISLLVLLITPACSVAQASIANSPSASAQAGSQDASASARTESSALPRHPIEREALTDPQSVLQQARQLQPEAQQQGRLEELALLYLAEANACRVIADWVCQREAGQRAAATAEWSGDAVVQVRGIIAEARGEIALGDFARGERALGRAEALLQTTPVAELQADIDLAYSSLSFRLGRHARAAEYASRGLAALGPGEAIDMQLRLLRNLAKTLILLERLPEARGALQRAESLLPMINDPKLAAEITLESARLARVERDVTTQLRAAEEIMRRSRELQNTQLEGLALETRGLALQQQGNEVAARADLAAAAASFRKLGLDRDELRALGHYLRLAARGTVDPDALNRHLDLIARIDRRDRAIAGDSFDDRLRYAEQELELLRLESRSELAAQQHAAAMQQLRYGIALTAATVLLLAAIVVLYILQRRWNRRLRDALDMRQRALLQTSHELRNPLAGVVGLSELLSRAQLPQREARMVEVIRHSAEHLARLAQDLLDRGRLEAGKLSLKPRPTDLRRLLQDVLQLHEPLAREKGLRLELLLPDDALPLLLLDETRLAQVLGNLIANGLKFTERGGLRIQLQHRADSAPPAGGRESATPPRYRLQLSVEDSGPGMDEEDLKRLFEPFRKGKAGQSHRTGAGLGLAISHELVALMGGRLRATSVPEVGTRFDFELLVDAAGPATLQPLADEDGEISDASELGMGTPLRVALVDDDDDVQLLHGEMLRHLGCEVSLYRDAAALLASSHQPNGFDLLVLDYELGDMTGVELARRWHAATAAQQAPRARIALVSGHAAPATLPREIDEWLQKPVSLSRWIMLLAATRSRRHGGTGLPRPVH